MRSTILLTLAILVLAEIADAQSEPSLTRDMQAMEAKLLTHIGPQTRTWIKQEAAREDASNKTSETTAVRALASFPYGRLSNRDTMALAFLVLIESLKSAGEDLKGNHGARKSHQQRQGCLFSLFTIHKSCNCSLKGTPRLP